MKYKLAEALLIIIGLFLFIDGIFLHAVNYDYSILGITFLDPYINHAVVGAFLILTGACMYVYHE
jgi:hypothetical protein